MPPKNPQLINRFSRIRERLQARGIVLPEELNDKIWGILGLPELPWTRMENHLSCLEDPRRYLQRHSKEQVSWHLKLLAKINESQKATVDLLPLPSDNCRLGIAGLDRAGVLACLTRQFTELEFPISEMEVVTYQHFQPLSSNWWSREEPRYLLDIHLTRGSEYANELAGRLIRGLLDEYPAKSSAEHRLPETLFSAAFEGIVRSSVSPIVRSSVSNSGNEDNPVDTMAYLKLLVTRVPLATVSDAWVIVCKSTEEARDAEQAALTTRINVAYEEAAKLGSHRISEGEEASSLKEGSFHMQDATSLIEQALEAFEHEFPQLLEKYPGEWVAYHGQSRIKRASTKEDVLRDCYQSGYNDAEIFVAKIQPDILEEYAVWEE